MTRQLFQSEAAQINSAFQVGTRRSQVSNSICWQSLNTLESMKLNFYLAVFEKGGVYMPPRDYQTLSGSIVHQYVTGQLVEIEMAREILRKLG